jgi:hypothetical protein
VFVSFECILEDVDDLGFPHIVKPVNGKTAVKHTIAGKAPREVFKSCFDKTRVLKPWI